jgi:hypothetical protein
MDEVIFRVKIDVSRRRLGLDCIRAARGLENTRNQSVLQFDRAHQWGMEFRRSSNIRTSRSQMPALKVMIGAAMDMAARWQMCVV